MRISMQPFLKHIREDFDDVDRQYVYADYLEEQAERQFADYVRIWAKTAETVIDSEEFWDLHLKRKRMLDVNHKLWEWDNFLALRHIEFFREQLREFFHHDEPSKEIWNGIKRAKPETLDIWEREYGHTFPIGLKEYVLEVADELPESYKQLRNFQKSPKNKIDWQPHWIKWDQLINAENNDLLSLMREFHKKQVADGIELEWLEEIEAAGESLDTVHHLFLFQPGLIERLYYAYTGHTNYIGLGGDIHGISILGFNGGSCYGSIIYDSIGKRTRALFEGYEYEPKFPPNSLVSLKPTGEVGKIPLDTITAMHLNFLEAQLIRV